jgi:hypothetical protein
MCDPTGITESMAVMGAVSTAVSVVAQKQQAGAQAAVINQQSQLRANQTAAAAGQQESQAAMKARQQQAESVAAASAAGVNTGSGSFMESMQTTNMNQANEDGLIIEQDQNQQQANIAETQSDLNSKATSPSVFGGLLDTGLAGADGLMKGQSAYNQGVNKPTPNTSSLMSSSTGFTF